MPLTNAQSRDLNSLLHPFSNLQTLAEQVDDTLMALSSDAWTADLAYYKYVREASRRNQPGARLHLLEIFVHELD